MTQATRLEKNLNDSLASHTDFTRSSLGDLMGTWNGSALDLHHQFNKTYDNLSLLGQVLSGWSIFPGSV
jgi:hypothetical protein